jgi:hypothetical protein
VLPVTAWWLRGVVPGTSAQVLHRDPAAQVTTPGIGQVVLTYSREGLHRD